MKKSYDVIIIGAGPSGIFAALELLKLNPDINVLMLEKGSDINERSCPMSDGSDVCLSCKECAIVSGWGGAGRSDLPDGGQVRWRGTASGAEVQGVFPGGDSIWIRLPVLPTPRHDRLRVTE